MEVEDIEGGWSIYAVCCWRLFDDSGGKLLPRRSDDWLRKKKKKSSNSEIWFHDLIYLLSNVGGKNTWLSNSDEWLSVANDGTGRWLCTNARLYDEVRFNC